MTPSDARPDKVAAALRQIGRGFAMLADAVAAGPEDVSSDERYRRVISEWGERGLTREQASALFRKHGFSPQAAGGWARGEWIETRPDGRRYLTQRSHEWLAAQEADDEH
jgi:hypothetical protein